MLECSYGMGRADANPSRDSPPTCGVLEWVVVAVNTDVLLDPVVDKRDARFAA
jgi:hypothetical protein